MAKNVQLRPMEPKDLPRAYVLWAEADGVQISEGDSIEQLEAYLQRNPGMSHVALDGDRLVGAVLAGHDGRRGLLYHVAVARDYQGQGVGRSMVQKAVAALKAAGIARVLILVFRDNEGGKRFWSTQGWESVSHAEAMGLNL